MLVVLAAGGGRRFTESGGVGHKLLVDTGGTPLVARAVRAASDAAAGEVVVVTGGVDLRGVLAGLPIRIIENPAWRDGIGTSLGVAIDAAIEAGAGSVVVGLGDQPAVTASSWRRVAGHRGPEPLVVATYDGVRGNPVRLGREIWDRLPRTGDEGARALLRARPDLVAEVACDGDPRDVDTVEDLERWT
jgi:molybdenum cofactor cytidylyltransferase